MSSSRREGATTDQDKAIGKGPLEKAGEKVDDAVKDLKK